MYRLIIVDDEWEALKGMRDTLPWEQWGFEVAGAASSGEEAWLLIETITPDVLLTDIRMDEMSGIQLIDRVHQKYPEIRSVIISGYSDIEYYRKALEYKVFDYILKPSREEDFSKIFGNLRTILDQERSKEERYHYFKEHWNKSREALLESFSVICQRAFTGRSEKLARRRRNSVSYCRSKVMWWKLAGA